jgi:hypothetical protein
MKEENARMGSCSQFVIDIVPASPESRSNKKQGRSKLGKSGSPPANSLVSVFHFIEPSVS